MIGQKCLSSDSLTVLSVHLTGRCHSLYGRWVVGYGLDSHCLWFRSDYVVIKSDSG